MVAAVAQPLDRRDVERLERADATADAAQRRECLTVVVIGGGLVGVELVGELTAFADDVLRLSAGADDVGRAEGAYLLHVPPQAGQRATGVVPEGRLDFQPVREPLVVEARQRHGGLRVDPAVQDVDHHLEHGRDDARSAGGAEHEAQPQVFASIPDAMWGAIVTMTTVGYGDITPQTILGRIIAAMTMLTGYSIRAADRHLHRGARQRGAP